MSSCEREYPFWKGVQNGTDQNISILTSLLNVVRPADLSRERPACRFFDESDQNFDGPGQSGKVFNKLRT
jgi:hypothetical protein